MSKLKELIKELCPNGVEYKPIKEVYRRLKGTPITAGKMKEIANDNGDIRIFAGGKTVINALEKDIPKANVTRVPAVLIQSRGVIDVVYYEKPFTFKNEMWAYTHENKISVKFLYYVLKNNLSFFRESASGMGSLPQISLKITEDFKIPIPHIEVQREIVRILDNFTELTEELTGELTEELTTRKKQYEYYRDNLLKYNNDVKICTLKDVCCSIADGDHMPPPKVNSGIPFITISNITDHNQIDFSNVMYVPHEYYDSLADKRKAKIGDILYTVVGSFGTPVHITNQTEFVFQRHIAILRPNQELVIPRYMYHAMQSSDFYRQADKAAKGAAQRTISLGSLGNMTIPVPLIDIQKRIADVLDNFEAICSDFNIDLPTEVELRKKQYEFYRDALLTFAETGNIIAQTDRQTDRPERN